MRRLFFGLLVAVLLAGCGAADVTTPSAETRPTSVAGAAQPTPDTPTSEGVTTPEPTAPSANARPTQQAAPPAASGPCANVMQFDSAPPMSIDTSKGYTATLKTAKGDVVIKLLPKSAPNTVNSFVFLAQQGYYDNITFHRVIPGFVAQTGDPSGTGLCGPGYEFANEYDASSGLDYTKAGVVGMANAGPDTNGSQFFITYGNVGLPPQGYTIFGEVVAGMDVLQQITPRDPSINPGAAPGDQLYTITIEEGQ